MKRVLRAEESRLRMKGPSRARVSLSCRVRDAAARRVRGRTVHRRAQRGRHRFHRGRAPRGSGSLCAQAGADTVRIRPQEQEVNENFTQAAK